MKISNSAKKDKKIKYIVSYDCPENAIENRVNVLASSNKIDYIVNKINDIGYNVELISTSKTKDNRFYRGKYFDSGTKSLRLFPTTPNGGLIRKVINIAIMRLSLALFFMRNISRGETVIIYHSAGNLWMIDFLKLTKKAHVIEEVEEIYGDIYGKPHLSKKEKRLLSKADAYIFPTKMLNQVVNDKSKNFITVHGSYQLNDDDMIRTSKFSDEDGLYHVGYTGILDPMKGCLGFIQSAEYLDDTYCLHVLGFGSEKEIRNVQETIDNLRRKTNCRIAYDGVRRGVEYDRYLQQLDAGICPLNSYDYFVKTQFPSKVISYLSNGLPVICSNIEAVRTSDVGSYISFYDGDGPEYIASAIKRIREGRSDVSPRQIVRQCDEKFGRELKEFLMKEVNHI